MNESTSSSIDRVKMPIRSSLVVTTEGSIVDRIDGFGPQLPFLIELSRRRYRGDVHEVSTWEQGKEKVAGWTADRVIWQGKRVVALLRATPDGTLAVIEFPPTGYPVAVDTSEIGGEQ